VLFDNAGDTAHILLDAHASDGSLINGVAGTLDLTLFSTSGSAWVFDYSVDNTTTNGDSRIVSFGFNVDPNFQSFAIGAGSYFDFGAMNSAIESVSLDFCTSVGNNCSSGGSEGLRKADGLATGRITLNFNPSVTAITLSGFTDKYQAVTAIGGNSARGMETSVPEPATWAMMIIGFGAAGSMIRRRREIAA
jgi:hypothetical protein